MTVDCLSVGELEANCYLLRTADGSGWIVDPGAEPERVLSAVNAGAFHPEAVLLTHAHFDHMGAAGAVCAALGIPLWVGAADADFLTDPVGNLSGVFGGVPICDLHADRLLREGDVLRRGAETLRVLETPGHTPGSLCFWGTDVLITGDTLFCQSIGRTDFPGSDGAAMRRSLARLMTLPDGLTVCPGHGPRTTLGQERRFNPFVE